MLEEIHCTGLLPSDAWPPRYTWSPRDTKQTELGRWKLGWFHEDLSSVRPSLILVPPLSPNMIPGLDLDAGASHVRVWYPWSGEWHLLWKHLAVARASKRDRKVRVRRMRNPLVEGRNRENKRRDRKVRKHRMRGKIKSGLEKERKKKRERSMERENKQNKIFRTTGKRKKRRRSDE